MKILLFIISCCLFSNIVFAKKNYIGKVIYHKGSVFIDNLKVKKGDQFTAGQTIKTNKDSYVVLSLISGSKLKLASLGVRGTEFFTSFRKKSKDVWMCVGIMLISA